MVDDSANSTGVDEEKLWLAAGGAEVPWSAEEEGTLSVSLPYASGGYLDPVRDVSFPFSLAFG